MALVQRFSIGDIRNTSGIREISGNSDMNVSNWFKACLYFNLILTKTSLNLHVKY